MQKIKTLFEIAASVVIVAGIPIFFYQQYLDNKKASIENSIKFAILFQGEDYIRSRFSLLQPFLQYDLEAFQAARPTKDVVQKFVVDLTQNNKDVVRGLYNVDEFFGTLGLCIDGKVCDELTAHRLFGLFAAEVSCLYAPAFHDISKKYRLENFGKNIIRFSSTDDACVSPSITDQVQ